MNWRWKAIMGFVNGQIWLPLSDNYITHVSEQSDTAGHYRAIGDQVRIHILKHNFISFTYRYKFLDIF